MRKLALLADAARHDVSCASGGAQRRDARGGPGMGSTSPMGVCHSFTPDGRCVALLKILLTNYCMYDCLYCINRDSSDVPRARFSVQEVVALTLDFYRRNCIEGLFLSSGIIQSPDYTMEQLVGVARVLREQHGFRGYIHLKTIPESDPLLVAQAGRYADRLSINLELPTEGSLQQLAPQKHIAGIEQVMQHTARHVAQASAARLEYRKAAGRMLPGPAGKRLAPPPVFASAGQSTQLLVGADRTSDAALLAASSRLYRQYGMRRVYYSAYSPIVHASARLPPAAPPLAREHRLYQADWLMRFYGFAQHEIVDGLTDGMLALEMDPKLAWALAHRQWFPVDLQSAPREMLLRVPGLGIRNVQRLLQARRVRTLCLQDLATLRVPLEKLKPFIMVSDHHPGRLLDSPDLAARLMPASALLQRQRQADGLVATAVAQGAEPVQQSAPVSASARRQRNRVCTEAPLAGAQLELFATGPASVPIAAPAHAESAG